MKFRTELKVKPLERPIRYNEPIFAIGSCFTDEVGARLKADKFRITHNPLGTLFNPLSIYGLLGRALHDVVFTPNEVQRHPTGECFLYGLPTRFTFADENALLHEANEALYQTKLRFHEADHVLVTFGTAWLYDELEVERIVGTGAVFENRGMAVDCPAEQNICLKAFHLMRDRYGVDGVRIALDKRVPFGAGLGGGSADGTMTLLALNELFALDLDEETLIDLAAELGSDTAFFVRNTPQLCTGRGERMTPIELPIAGLWIALVKPDEGVSTREAYAGVKPAVPEVSLRQRLALPIAEWQGVVKNDFEPHIFAAHPAIEAAKEQLLQAGALYASMSGSGSTVFGLFDDENKARQIDTPFIYQL